MARAAGDLPPSEQVTVAYPERLPMGRDFGLSAEQLPLLVSVDQPDASGQMVSKLYYRCIIRGCPYRTQNHLTALTHMRREHYNIQIGCPFCDRKPLDAPSRIEDHICDTHANMIQEDGKLILPKKGDLTAAEAESVVASLAGPSVKKE